MKKTILALIIPIAMGLAADSSEAKKKAAAPPPTIPKEAKEVSPGVYRYTDAQGKNWIYGRTPFGISKVEERAEPAADSAAPPQAPVAQPKPATQQPPGDRTSVV